MLMREGYNVLGKMTSFLLECLHFPPLWLVSLVRLTGVMALKGLMSLRADTEICFAVMGGGAGVKSPFLKGKLPKKWVIYPF